MHYARLRRYGVSDLPKPSRRLPTENGYVMALARQARIKPAIDLFGVKRDD
jgi:hypothetical protein